MTSIPHAPSRPATRPSAMPATVAAYLDSGNTQQAAARFFGCSERTIRNRLAEHRLDVAQTAQEPPRGHPQRPGRRLRRIDRPHHAYAAHRLLSAAPVGTPVPKRFLPIAPHVTAGPHTSWCAWDGELRPVVPGMTGAAWNAEQKRLQQAAAQKRRTPSLPDVATVASVPDVPPVAASQTLLPEAPAARQPLPPGVTIHNAVPIGVGSVKRSHPRPAPKPPAVRLLAWARVHVNPYTLLALAAVLVLVLAVQWAQMAR